MSLLARFNPGDPVIRICLGALWQATVIMLAAALLAGTVLRRRAAARHDVLIAALVWVLLSPVLAAVAGIAGASLRVITLTCPIPVVGAESGRVPDGDDAVGNPKPDGDAPSAGPIREPGVSLPEAPRVARRAATRPGEGALGGAAVLWATGVIIGLGRIALGWRRVASLTRSARPLDPVRYGATMASVRDALGVVALPPIETSAKAAGPVALGLIRPRVVLPEGLAETVTTRALRDVLVHECAHALRHDPRAGLLQRVAGALFWPHPLVHYLNGQLARAREEVCDNHVLRCDDARGYARTLLALTERYRPSRVPGAGLGLLEARWTLADRVNGILDPGRIPETRTSSSVRVSAAVALAATGLAAAMVHLAPSARAGGSQGPGPAPTATAPESFGAEVWRIRGVVVDEQGRPVAGAVVRVPASADANGVGGGTTAADGSFTITLGGRHRQLHGLVAEDEGGARVGLSRPGVLNYRTREPIRIVLKPTRPVTVRVKDATGVPIAGAAVEAVDYGYQTHGRTGPGGDATLRVAADARIRWVIGQKTGAGLDYFENYRTRLPTEYPPLPPELTLTLDGARPLRIRAVDSEGWPVRDVRMSPVLIQRSAKVDVVSAAFAATSWVTTDQGGIAVFDRLHEDVGGCQFVVRSKAYLCARDPVSERNGPTELTVRLVRPTRLSGTVKLPDGRPARNIIVRAEGTLPHTLGTDRLARTGDDGAYSLDVLPDRAYIVAVEDETWAASSRTGIVVREGRPQDGLDLTLGRGTLVHGRITEGVDRGPSEGAGVSLIEEGPLLPKEFRSSLSHGQLARTARADAQGRYRFRVGPGRYMLRVQYADPLTIEVKDEPEVVRDLTLKTSARATYVAVAVVEKTAAGDRPVARASLNTVNARGGTSPSDASDDQGRGRTVRWPDSLLYARGDGGRLSGFAVVPETAETVNVVVSPAARITGRVVDTDGRPQPLRRVLLELTLDPDRVVSHRFREVIRTDPEGRFAFLGAPPGTRGEVAAYHENERRANGARTVVPFKVDEPEEVEVGDLTVPPAGRPGAGRAGASGGA